MLLFVGSVQYMDIPDLFPIQLFEFIKKGLAHEDIILNSAGLPRRDNIYIDDAVTAALLIGATGDSGECYNISSMVNWEIMQQLMK